MIDSETSTVDTVKAADEPKSAARILGAIAKAEDHWQSYQALCDRIDDIYARVGDSDIPWSDPNYDLFWASTEVLKPAIYARVPKPVVAPMFNDRRKLYVTTADVLERSVTSSYEHSGLDEALQCVRDDLIFYNRGALWVAYESDGGQRVCIDHVDRKDFLHPPARKWSELPWVARRAWLSREEMHERFPGKDVALATYTCADGDDRRETAGRAGVWEVWHKGDDRVYWVTPGVTDILDENPPHYDLEGFFPCPRPAFGTLKPRTLEPRPDFIRYAGHFQKINSLTRRIYALLDMVRMKGLIAAGGDIGDAIEQLVRDDSNASVLIPVPGALISGSAAANFVQWLPVAEIATAITGLIEARRELMADYDRLSGISDIMRGETEAQETLGAQRLKGQYGSVRVKSKCDEIVRLSRDVTRIAAELMAENFSQKTLLDMSQMEVPTKADLKKQVSEVEKAAKEELKALAEKANQAPTPQEPQQAQQMQGEFQQAQQAILAKYAPQLKKLEDEVSVDDVMRLLRDHKARNFAFEIETDSTILTDEAEAKASATEFYQAFTGGMQGLIGAASMGEEAIRVASEVLKYTLSPYRPPRSVLAAIDDFLDAAPQIAERQAAQQGGGEDQQAMQQLAQAELQKAQAQTMKAQADAELKAAELQGRMQEGQIKAQQDQQRFALEVEKSRGTVEETGARIEKIYAEIKKLGVDSQVSVSKEQRETVKTAADIEGQQQDRAMAQRQQVVGEAQAMRADQRADRGEDRADRQQEFAERNPANGP